MNSEPAGFLPPEDGGIVDPEIFSRRLAFISELSRHVGEDLTRLLDFIVKVFPEACQLEKCTIFLLDEKKVELVAKASNAFSPEELNSFKVLLRGEKGEVAISTEPFMSPDAPNDPRLVKEYVEKCRIKSLLTIPLKVRGKILGAIHLVNSQTPHTFTSDEIVFINALAAEVSLAIESTLLEEERQARAEEMERLRVLRADQEKALEMSRIYEAAQMISSFLDLDPVLSEAARRLCGLAEASRCLIFLMDEERRVLASAFVHGVSPEQREFFSALAVPMNFLEAGNLWGRFRQGHPLILERGKLEPEAAPLENLFSLFGTRNCLLAPLMSERRLTGLVYLDDPEKIHEFAPAQIRSVAALSIHAGTAIERAQLYRQTQDQARQVHNLYQISTALSTSLNLERILGLIIEKSAQLVSCERFCLFMWDEELDGFAVAASRGLSDEFIKKAVVKIEDRFVGLAAHRRKPVYSANVLLETDNPQLARLFKKEGLGAVLAVPLVTKRKTIAVITCFADLGYQFKEKEIHLLGNFAGHAALSIENARLYNLNRQKVQELGILFDVGKKISEHLDLGDVLRAMAEQFTAVMKADGCSIMLLDQEGKTLSIHTTRGAARRSNLHKKIPVGEGFVGQVVRTGRSLVMQDKGSDREENPFPKALKDEGIATVLSVPLAAKEEILGVVNLYAKERRHYSPAKMHLLETLAGQGAVAVRNARTFEENYHVAQLIHRSLMPSQLPAVRELDFGFQYLPSQEISGDYYDFLELDGKLGIAVADVSGKGTQAAIFTAQGKYAWKAYGLLQSDPSRVLTLLNRLMYENTPSDKFVSLFYGVMDLKRKEFVYSNAGHFPPVLYRRAAEKCRFLDAPGLLLGVEKKAAYAKRSVFLHPGDMLVLYTDGVVEARGENGQLYGTERLARVIQENAGMPAQIIANKILSGVRHHASRRIPEDDITIVVVKVR